MNTILIKHGTGVPGAGKLQNYELGYVNGGALYIGYNNQSVQLTDPKTIGLVNANNYLQLPAVTATTSNTGRILVCDSSGIVYYKTAANIRSEIGALSTGGGTISGNLTVSGKLTANGTIVVDTDSYGYKDPNTAGTNGAALSGTTGQLYFVVTG